MKKLYCPYCGEPIENGCDCERYAAEELEERIEAYYNDPMVNEGFRQQDTTEMYRRER